MLLAFAVSCSEQGSTAPPLEQECALQERFEEQILPIVRARCASCHGREPDFGAPFSLLDFDAITHGSPGERIVDRIVSALQSSTMPPPGSAQLTFAERQALVDWASCGTETVELGGGLQANRPVWRSSPESPRGLRRIDLLADGHVVKAGGEEYFHFNFGRNIVEHDVFIRRFEIVLDKTQVLHHLTLSRYEDGVYLYAWGPGTAAFEFPEGGFRIDPSTRLVMQIHYSNVAGREDVEDASGIAIYVAEPVGPEYAMKNPAPSDEISVPPNSRATVRGECTSARDFEILASLPHMHEIGESLSYEVVRKDGPVESIVRVDGWSFESQYIYDTPVTVRAGDILRIACTYENPGDTTVVGGILTSEEMCFNFTYVTPPEGAGNLDCSPQLTRGIDVEGDPLSDADGGGVIVSPASP